MLRFELRRRLPASAKAPDIIKPGVAWLSGYFGPDGGKTVRVVFTSVAGRAMANRKA